MYEVAYYKIHKRVYDRIRKKSETYSYYIGEAASRKYLYCNMKYVGADGLIGSLYKNLFLFSEWNGIEEVKTRK